MSGTVSLKHATQISGTNNPAYQVSKDPWNAEHNLTQNSAGLLGSDAAGVTEVLTPAEAKALLSITTADVSGFQEATEDLIGASVIAGTNVTVTYDDGTGKTTISASGGGGSGVTDGDKGDITVSSSGATWTLDTVNSNVGSFGSASAVATFTVNAKGLVTAAGSTSITIAISSVTGLQTALDGKQPLDSDLTAIAALTTATYGRSLLTLANATALAAEVDSFFLTPTEGNAAYQPLDSDLTSWAGVTRASGFDTFTATPSSANLRSLLTDETGTGAAVFATSPTLTTPTVSGNLTQTLSGGYWTDQVPVVNIARFDRLFVSKASTATGKFDITDQGGTIPNDTSGAAFLSVHAALLSEPSNGGYAIVGASRASDQSGTTSSIGVAGALINDKAASTGWAFYGDVQHENATAWSAGLEVAVKNKSSANAIPTPYSDPVGAYGVWIMGGGDPAYGGTAANPSAAAIVVEGFGHTWNKGLVFKADGLTGTAGTGTGTGVAIEMARGHMIQWRNETTDAAVANIRSDIGAGGALVQQVFSSSGVEFYRGSSLLHVIGTNVASAVNGISLGSNATGNAPSVAAIGSDTNIDLQISPKGTGLLRASATLVPNTSDGAALGTTALMWSDLFLASGSVINWNNGDVTLTHASNTLAFAGGANGYNFDANIGAGNSAGSSAGLGRAITVNDATSCGFELKIGGTLTGYFAAQAGFFGLATPSTTAIQFITNNASRVTIGASGNLDLASGNVLSVAGTQVVTARRTGWAAATGTATRTTFVTGTVTLPVLAEHVKALIDDLTTHGLIGT